MRGMRGNFAPKMIEYLPFLDLQDPTGFEITSQAARQSSTLETRAIQMLQLLCHLLLYTIHQSSNFRNNYEFQTTNLY